MKSHTATVDGITMRWEEEGGGLPLVLVHGIPTGPALWRHVAPRLRDARCLAWEMVGYGASIAEGRDRDISVARQADYLVSWLKHLDISEALLAGHDLGGGVVQIAAVRHPGLCRGLFLTNAIGYDSWPIPSVKAMRMAGPLVKHLPDPAFKQVFRTFIQRGHDDSAKAEDAFATHWPHYESHGGAAAFIRQVDALDVQDTLAVADDLPKLKIPARVAWGVADAFQKIEYGERFARDLAAPLRRIENGKHFTPEDHPEVVAAELQQLIDALEPTPHAHSHSRDDGNASVDDLPDALATVKSLAEVMPQDADPMTREIYEDIQATLRVPFVNQFFRLLATDPAYLKAAWNHVAPIARTRDFEEAARKLRGEAVLMGALKATTPPRETLGDLDRVRRFTVSIHYALPKLLLIASLLDRQTAAPGDGPDLSLTIPRGIAPGSEKIPMQDPSTEAVRGLLEEIRSRHRHPAAATYFRSLAQWPELLQALWSELRPHVGSEPYGARRSALTQDADEVIDTLKTDDAPPEPSKSCQAVLTLFRRRVIPELLIDVTLVRVMLEGPESVSANPLDIL